MTLRRIVYDRAVYKCIFEKHWWGQIDKVPPELRTALVMYLCAYDRTIEDDSPMIPNLGK